MSAARTIAQAIVRIATAAAPADVRADLRAEWQAEIAWWIAHPPPGTAVARDRSLIRRSLGISVTSSGCGSSNGALPCSRRI